MVTIDHNLNIAIDESVGGNELTTLNYLSVGLLHLAHGVAKVEAPIREREQNSNEKRWGYGNLPDLPPGAVYMLPCLFHWFGVSVINYARLVGFLSGLASNKFSRQDLEDKKVLETVNKHCKNYVDNISELKEVKLWRDKVAAHFAITAPKKEDNIAMLDFSVMYPVGYADNRFRVNVHTFTRTDSVGIEHQATLLPWSVTEVFEMMESRYWRTNLGDSGL
jgi:hypothetical protein